MARTRRVNVTFEFADDAKPEDMDALVALFLKEFPGDMQDYLLGEDGEPKWSRLSHMPVLATDVRAESPAPNLTERLERANLVHFGSPVTA